MFAPDQYQLIDFGEGRRLERFGPVCLDRPCAPAERIARENPAAWDQADARFERTGPEQGVWHVRREPPPRWTVRHGPVVLELKLTDFGHLGVFPEHAVHWEWLASQMAGASPPLAVLHLFAYTGGSTLAAAAAGAGVTHVDAARNTVAWARRNAQLSEMADRPIRWIGEDALKFVRRELKRGNGYDAMVLDPPTYGHGPRGEVWRLSEHLTPLLEMCGQLTAGRRRFILLTCHTPEFDAARLERMLGAALGDEEKGRLTAFAITIPSASGRLLPSGVAVRWERISG